MAIEKRSSEVWGLLEAVKTEFGKFEDVIKKTIRNLDSARHQMDALEVRTRAVTRKTARNRTERGSESDDCVDISPPRVSS